MPIRTLTVAGVFRRFVTALLPCRNVIAMSWVQNFNEKIRFELGA